MSTDFNYDFHATLDDRLHVGGPAMRVPDQYDL
jgi:hypothetical protein